MNIATIALSLLFILLPVMAFVFIKPDGRYHCHIAGCGCSFDTMGELVGHLKTEHDYSNESIDEFLYEIENLR